MITLYNLPDKTLVQQKFKDGESLPKDALWVDLLSPTTEERRLISEAYNQPLPSEPDLKEIEASSRFFVDNNGLHLRSFFLYQYPDRHENITVAFILNQGRLFTLRDEKFETFHSVKQMIAAGTMRIKDNFDLLFSLFEIKVDRLADKLEIKYGEIEKISRNVYDGDNKNLEEIILQLGSLQDVNDKIRRGLLDMQRLFSFLKRTEYSTGKNSKNLQRLIEDIDSLVQYTNFILEKSDSLLSVTIGLINSEQNKIIKIFSIISVVFLPPTLVASIYGMNFTHMPELQWPFGYPWAVCLILLSAISPYLLFRFKGWL
jgi:magnesium transporter